MVNSLQVSKPLRLSDFRHHSSFVSDFNHRSTADIKSQLLKLLTEMRDNDIPKIDNRIRTILCMTEQNLQVKKSLENVRSLLPNDVSRLKNDVNELIVSLEYIPAEKFEFYKINQVLLANEKIEQEKINEMSLDDLFQNLFDIIDHLWISKQSRVKLQTFIIDLKIYMLHLKHDNNELKLAVSRLQEKDAFTKYQSCVNELMRIIVRSIKKEFRRKLHIEYISENFDELSFESLFDDPEHEEIKQILDLNDEQIDLLLTIFDKICNKYGFKNSHILANYLSLVSSRNSREHDMMDLYIKSTADEQRSFKDYCTQYNLMKYYNEKDEIILENLFKLYARDVIRQLQKKQEK